MSRVATKDTCNKGNKVWSPVHGYGKVISITDSIIVEFENDASYHHFYVMDGRRTPDDPGPSLFVIEDNMIPCTFDNIVVGDRVWNEFFGYGQVYEKSFMYRSFCIITDDNRTLMIDENGKLGYCLNHRTIAGTCGSQMFLVRSESSLKVNDIVFSNKFGPGKIIEIKEPDIIVQFRNISVEYRYRINYGISSPTLWLDLFHTCPLANSELIVSDRRKI